MNNPSIPIKLAVARVIAEQVAATSGPYSGVSLEFLKNLEYWATRDWEKESPCWQYIVDNLPEILAKLAEIDGH